MQYRSVRRAIEFGVLALGLAAWAVGVALSYFAYWTTGSLAQVLAFILVIVFLQLRPQGMFTVRTRSLV